MAIISGTWSLDIFLGTISTPIHAGEFNRLSITGGSGGTLELPFAFQQAIEKIGDNTMLIDDKHTAVNQVLGALSLLCCTVGNK